MWVSDAWKLCAQKSLHFTLKCLRILLDVLASHLCLLFVKTLGLPSDSDAKESACNAGDAGLIPGLGRFPGEGNGNLSNILAWRIPRTEEPGGLHTQQGRVQAKEC